MSSSSKACSVLALRKNKKWQYPGELTIWSYLNLPTWLESSRASCIWVLLVLKEVEGNGREEYPRRTALLQEKWILALKLTRVLMWKRWTNCGAEDALGLRLRSLGVPPLFWSITSTSLHNLSSSDFKKNLLWNQRWCVLILQRAKSLKWILLKVPAGISFRVPFFVLLLPSHLSKVFLISSCCLPPGVAPQHNVTHVVLCFFTTFLLSQISDNIFNFCLYECLKHCTFE